MKRNLFLGILIILIMILSCKSHLNNANKLDTADTIYSDTTIKRISFGNQTYNLMLIYEGEQDTIKKAVINKEIQPIQIDTTKKIKRNSNYNQLEKMYKSTEQRKTTDSIVIIVRKIK